MDDILKCTEILAELPLFVGGELDGATEEAIARHLDACRDCEREHARLRLARSRIAELRSVTPAPSEGVWAGIRAELAAEGRLRPSAQPSSIRSSPRLPRWVPVAAAAAVVAAVVWVGNGVGTPGRGSSDAPTAQTNGLGAPTAQVADHQLRKVGADEPSMLPSARLFTLPFDRPHARSLDGAEQLAGDEEELR